MPASWLTILIGAAGWVTLIAAFRFAIMPWLARAPQADPVNGLIWRLIRLYCRVVHRANWVGLEGFRNQMHPGPLIVVANHTGAIDPLLIQAGCRFHIRWMMASEMMLPQLDWLWKQQNSIPVDRDGKDMGPAREAIRHVQAGGAVGIFPEGRIVQPPQQIRPFFTGVGLIVSRAEARVLLVWISGTPDAPSMLASLITPSHARIEYLELIDFHDQRDGHIITQRLRERLLDVSGWPANNEPLTPKNEPAEV